MIFSPTDARLAGDSGGTTSTDDWETTAYIVTRASELTDIDRAMVLPHFHPTPKELKAMHPYKRIDYVSIVPRGTFNRKLLFPFSGYLPKRVRARIKSREEK